MKTIAGLAGLGAAQFLFSYCPEVTLKQNFDVNKYLGTWYEMSRSKKNKF